MTGTVPRGTVALVAQREIVSRLRSKAFLISTAILIIAALASVVIGGLVGGSDHTTKVAVVGEASTAVEHVDGLEGVPVDSESAGVDALEAGDVDAVVVPDVGTPTQLKVIGLDEAPTTVVAGLSVPPEVSVLHPAEQSPLLVYFVALGFGLVFFMSAITFGQTIAQSVVEEKQTRVVEILLSTVSSRTLLTGKVIGNSLLAFCQIAVIAILTLVALAATGQQLLLGDLGASVAWFVVFFAIGFVMIAGLYAATAALVSRQEDVGAATSPVMILVILPYILVISFNSNPTVLAVMSYIPFSAMVGMPMRVFTGAAAWWEPLVSLLILVLTTAAVLALGARIYSNSLLHTGGRMKVTEAMRG